jgi:hypothetical protein
MNVAGSLELLDHDHGHWCITCQLSTGIRSRWAAINNADQALGLRTTLWCTECAGRNIHVTPDPRRCAP